MEQFLAQHVVAAVFVLVLARQLGVPFPAFPVLLWAGARAVDDPLLGLSALIASVLAGSAGNLPWFWAGRRYGYRILKLVCTITLSPDSCVRESEIAFERRGPLVLLVARFVPGLETVSPPLAGALRLDPVKFLAYDAAGGALWAGAGLGLGLAFHGEIEWLLDWLAEQGGKGLLLIAAMVLVYVGYRFFQRWRFLRSLEAARISVAELYAMMRRGDEPVVLDVRSRAHRELDGRRIPGAHAVDLDDLERTLAHLARDQEVVVYCACPNEATAARVALQLRERGFLRVRPLAGGIDAWVSAGLPVESALLVE
ncbi:MAG: VTT domain-containing protein [Betaproteobacteria bacterium]|nr:VTT domain-containing protein [Betaproteobacteria bacterium]